MRHKVNLAAQSIRSTHRPGSAKTCPTGGDSLDDLKKLSRSAVTPTKIRINEMDNEVNPGHQSNGI
jgi:hypothetical protein